jgi:hypothetical protein
MLSFTTLYHFSNARTKNLVYNFGVENVTSLSATRFHTTTSRGTEYSHNLELFRESHSLFCFYLHLYSYSGNKAILLSSSSVHKTDISDKTADETQKQHNPPTAEFRAKQLTKRRQMFPLTRRIRFPHVSEWALFTRDFPLIGLDAKIKRRIKTILTKRDIGDVAKTWEKLNLSSSELEIKQYLFRLLEIHFSIKSIYLLPGDAIIALVWDETGDIGDVEFYSEIEHHFSLDKLHSEEFLSLIEERSSRFIDLVYFLCS